MRTYTVEDINRPLTDPIIIVYANTAKEAIKKVYRVENVKQDKYGNIIVKTLINTGKMEALIREQLEKIR